MTTKNGVKKKKNTKISNYYKLLERANTRLMALTKIELNKYLTKLPNKIRSMMDNKLEEYIDDSMLYNKKSLLNETLDDVIQEELLIIVEENKKNPKFRSLIKKILNKKLIEVLNTGAFERVRSELAPILIGHVSDFTKKFVETVKDLPKMRIDDIDINDPKLGDSALGKLILRMIAKELVDID